MPTLHVLIASIGRQSLQGMLDSILPFLLEDDHVTIVFDGVEPTVNAQELQTQTKGTVHIHHELFALGFWGHGVRNKYNALLERTDFVLHADDDDTYKPDAFRIIREECKDVKNLYIMKLHNVTRNTYVPPLHCNKIENTNIGTPCGIIPYELNLKGIWGCFYGGDFAFYESIAHLADSVVFSESVIYAYNCRWY